MIPALMIGRAGSTGYPGKNVTPVLGRPLCAYPLMAARASRNVDGLFVSNPTPQPASFRRRTDHVAELLCRHAAAGVGPSRRHRGVRHKMHHQAPLS